MSEANLKLVKSLYEDMSLLFANMTADTEWYETEGFLYGGTYTGPEEVQKNVFAPLMGDWDDFAATPHTFLPSGDDHVVVLGDYTGVHKRTGKPLDATFAHVYTLRSGKIARFRQYVDSAKANAAAE